jgi:N-formylglutamate deformylase
VNDIDVDLLDAPWPEPVVSTDYTKRGMGLIRRLALPGVPMYERKLTVAEVRGRIDRYYLPYRRALQAELDAAYAREGRVFHFNCHSMKSQGNAMNVDRGSARPDFVISDREGRTAPPKLTAWVAQYFSARGYTVKVNDPYKGGDIVRSFGDPARRRYSVQIEVNRSCYLDESTCARSPGFLPMCTELGGFAAAVAGLVEDTPAGYFD